MALCVLSPRHAVFCRSVLRAPKWPFEDEKPLTQREIWSRDSLFTFSPHKFLTYVYNLAALGCRYPWKPFPFAVCNVWILGTLLNLKVGMPCICIPAFSAKSSKLVEAHNWFTILGIWFFFFFKGARHAVCNLETCFFIGISQIVIKPKRKKNYSCEWMDFLRCLSCNRYGTWNCRLAWEKLSLFSSSFKYLQEHSTSHSDKVGKRPVFKAWTCSLSQRRDETALATWDSC